MNENVLSGSLYADDIAKIVSEADEILAGKYVYNNVWDMEPCDVPVDNRAFDWSLTYHGDREWAYMFVRFDFSYKLILAYEKTGDRKYLNFALRWLDRWAEHNALFLMGRPARVLQKLRCPKGLGSRSLDIAILAANAADLAVFCRERGLISELRLRRIGSYVKVICRNVLSLDNEFRTLANWGPIENGNILYAMLRLQLDLPYAIPAERLRKELEAQILSDGSQTESSPMYLVQILLTVFRNMARFGEYLPEGITELTRLGCDYVFRIAGPDNCIPGIGDSDRIDISDLMAAAAKLFHDGKYLQRMDRRAVPEFVYRYGLTEEEAAGAPFSYWGGGIEVQKFNTQVLIKDSDRKLCLLLSNIPNGPSGHKHYDYLSFILFVNGRELLIDSGRETYKMCDIRAASKAPRSHNTCEVNAGRYWKQLDEWDVEQSVSILPYSVSDDGRSVRMGISLGEEQLRVYRTFTYDPAAGLRITDEIDGDGAETYDAYFNFAENTELIRAEEAGNRFEIRSGAVRMYYSNDGAGTAEAFTGRASRRYNRGFEHPALRYSGTPRTVTHFLTFDDGVQATAGTEEKN